MDQIPPTETCWESAKPVFSTDLDLPDRRQGKVRDTYTLPAQDPNEPDRMLIVASDRISAFDVVMPTPIPGKGRVLTSIAAFWLRWIESNGLGPTHLVSTDDRMVPDRAFRAPESRSSIEGRSTIGTRCRVIPIECVVRGYLEGSGWKEYQESGSVCGIALPGQLTQCAKLPEPIFTPATKAEEGHDENIGFDQASRAVDALGGDTLMRSLRERSISIYTNAAAYALERGIILADTKFEFGFPINASGEIIDDTPILIDEALTPDSSRFWDASAYEPGSAQASFDKQFVREFLETLVANGSWDKTDPGPEIPDEIVRGTLERYTRAAAMLTGPKR